MVGTRSEDKMLQPLAPTYDDYYALQVANQLAPIAYPDARDVKVVHGSYPEDVPDEEPKKKGKAKAKTETPAKSKKRKRQLKYCAAVVKLVPEDEDEEKEEGPEANEGEDGSAGKQIELVSELFHNNHRGAAVLDLVFDLERGLGETLLAAEVRRMRGAVAEAGEGEDEDSEDEKEVERREWIKEKKARKEASIRGGNKRLRLFDLD
ncbi:hypothetical protein BDV96DRAFT_593560 [Lophiotrema nucula]|uniref:Uncharacterized protein n=1 Tax=Lophiotrema nucula TaxID=690887 RepID=A0A6A5ZUD2_9PLEO|nr:hypothetical protein BDV96DRAFT_593560 [Lophiotrema nucula]